MDDFKAAALWSIPDSSPWANLKVWDEEQLASPLTKVRQATDNIPRSSYRGIAPRNRAMRGRPPIQRGRGRSTSYPTYRREDSRTRYNYHDQDWHNNGSPERYSSGVGRSSGGAREPRRDSIERPGHREAREHRDSRDPRDSRRDREESRDRRETQRSRRGNYDSRQEGQFTDDSSGRENRRGDSRRNYGSERAKSYGYRNT